MARATRPEAVIELTGLTARGRHGVLPQERVEAQTFVVDVRLRVAAPDRDDIADTLDYRIVARIVVDRIENESVQLIETLAQDILDDLLGLNRVRRARVRVHKPEAPLGVAFTDLSVSVSGENPPAPQAGSRPQ